MFFTKCISCQSKNRFVKNNMCMLTFFNIGSDLSISDLHWEEEGGGASLPLLLLIKCLCS